MTAYERLDLLFEQNNGILKTAQVLENGITKSTYGYGIHPQSLQNGSSLTFCETKAGVERKDR